MSTPPKQRPRWAIGAALALACCVPATFAAQLTIVDGSLWKQSSPAERRAYLVGIGNTITIGNLYDQQKVPGQHATFMRRLATVIAEFPVTLEAAEQRIDAWYNSHPNQLAKPVFAVLWLEFIKPHLGPLPK